MSGCGRDGDVLVLQELVDADESAFAARAGVLDAAEGCGGAGDESGLEAEFGVVGGGDGLVLIVEGEDGGDRSEDLRVAGGRISPPSSTSRVR
jgi:hypothetical protein